MRLKRSIWRQNLSGNRRSRRSVKRYGFAPITGRRSISLLRWVRESGPTPRRRSMSLGCSTVTLRPSMTNWLENFNTTHRKSFLVQSRPRLRNVGIWMCWISVVARGCAGRCSNPCHARWQASISRPGWWPRPVSGQSMTNLKPVNWLTPWANERGLSTSCWRRIAVTLSNRLTS